MDIGRCRAVNVTRLAASKGPGPVHHLVVRVRGHGDFVHGEPECGYASADQDQLVSLAKIELSRLS
jgi:hypothetical protein